MVYYMSIYRIEYICDVFITEGVKVIEVEACSSLDAILKAFSNVNDVERRFTEVLEVRELA